jgi:hypothetical protein
LKKLIALTFAFFFSFSAFAGLQAFDNSKKALDLAFEQFTENTAAEVVETYRAVKIWHHEKDTNVRIYLRGHDPVLYKCTGDRIVCTLVK